MTSSAAAYQAHVAALPDDRLLAEWRALGQTVLLNELARYQMSPGVQLTAIIRTIQIARGRAEMCGREVYRRRLKG